MILAESYKLVKPSIVAFAVLHQQIIEAKISSSFKIFGTGFVAHKSGLIITNQHVLDEVEKFKPIKNNSSESDIRVIYFQETDDQVETVNMKILSSFSIEDYTPLDPFFDRKKPDIAVVSVNINNLIPVNIDFSSNTIIEGKQIATSGFPMGNDALAPSGYFSQISPILQTGIISALQPFLTKTPVSFMVNLMIQGGASGSPVFNNETGKVIGVINSSLIQRNGHPTNFSYAIPMTFLENCFNDILKGHLENNSEKLITIEEHRTQTYTVDGKSGNIVDNN